MKSFALVARAGEQVLFTSPGHLPAGIVGCIGSAKNINLKTAATFKIFVAGADGAIVLGMLPIVTEATAITVVPDLKIYIADASGNAVDTIIAGTPTGGADTARDAFGLVLSGAKTLYMSEGQVIWGEVTTGATGTSMTGRIDVLGYIPL